MAEAVIRPMDSDAMRRIVAGQAVSDLASAVKELVDNSLDAGSQSINIRLFNQGLDLVEVSDDGCGVPLASRSALATLHATSKIENFDDIGRDDSLGFRGEALHSLANLSERLVVATRTANDAVAQKLEFCPDGTVDSIAELPRKVGTTVAVIRLFDKVPVRRKDLERHLSKHRSKMIKLLEAYAIFSVGVRFNVMDMQPTGGNSDNCREHSLMATVQNSASFEQTISSVLGSKHLASMTAIEADLAEAIPEAKLEGYVSSTGPTAPKTPVTPVQYFCINDRPVHLPAISRILNEAWRTTFAQIKKPSCILRLHLPPESFDVNVSPDKREVILTNEKVILQLIQKVVSQQWSMQTNGRFAKSIISQVSMEEEENVPTPSTAPKRPVPEGTARPGSRFRRRGAFAHDLGKAKLQHEYGDDMQREEEPGTVHSNKRPRVETQNKPSHAVTPTTREVHRNWLAAATTPASPTPETDRKDWQRAQVAFNRSPVAPMQIDIEEATASEKRTVQNVSESCLVNSKLTDYGFRTTKAVKRVSNDLSSDFVDTEDEETPVVDSRHKRPDSITGVRRVSNVSSQQKPRSSSGSVEVFQHNTTRSSTEDKNVSSSEEEGETEDDSPAPNITWKSFGTTQDVVGQARARLNDSRNRRRFLRQTLKGATADVFDPNADAPQNTSHSEQSAANPTATVSLFKSDFNDGFDIIGQFNMGFILAKSLDNHLWIFDQHACDERYNFEKLCKETVIREQPLMVPLQLDLTPSEEMCIVDNLEVFEINGFRFKVDQTRPPRQRLALVALPHSGAQDGHKAVQFGQEDVSALCAVLGVEETSYNQEGGTGTDGSGASGNNAVRRYAGAAMQNVTDKIIERLPKAIAMFASRACRRSIMVGKALSENEMTGVIERLSGLSHPWQCAHGRTTLNHVGDLGEILLKDETEASEYVAGPTVKMVTQEYSTSAL